MHQGKVTFHKQKIDSPLRKIGYQLCVKGSKVRPEVFFLPECGIKRSTDIQLCPLSLLPGETSATEFLSFLTRWLLGPGRRVPGPQRGKVAGGPEAGERSLSVEVCSSRGC